MKELPKLTSDQLKGQGGACETVKVKADNEAGFMVINAHDYDEDEHTLVEEPKATKAEAKAKAKSDAADKK